jgi:putative tryptophan/tyrosine transport system substrate-binding protein
MRRREFIALTGGAAVAWQLTARAQQPNQMRSVGVLMAYDETDPEARALLAAFTQGLSELGWTDGRNLRLDVRWAPPNTDAMRTYVKELVALQPDVILANTTVVTAAFQRETQTIPIVFSIVADPVGSGFVASLSRPRGNITGFGSVEASFASKWLELLTEIAPNIKRTAIMFNPETAPYIRSTFLPLFEVAAQSFKVTLILAPVHDDDEIEMAINALGHEPGGGLLAMPDNFVEVHRARIVSLAVRSNVPTVSQSAVIARDGGLLSYAADFRDIFRRSARYVDGILRGGKPSELPVQMPIKYLMVINLKTAKALGLTVPPALLVAADEVIE